MYMLLVGLILLAINVILKVFCRNIIILQSIQYSVMEVLTLNGAFKGLSHVIGELVVVYMC